jgi:hypothetical protein
LKWGGKIQYRVHRSSIYREPVYKTAWNTVNGEVQLRLCCTIWLHDRGCRVPHLAEKAEMAVETREYTE